MFLSLWKPMFLPRLTRKLNILEFVLAFSTFRDGVGGKTLTNICITLLTWARSAVGMDFTTIIGNFQLKWPLHCPSSNTPLTGAFSFVGIVTGLKWPACQYCQSMTHNSEHYTSVPFTFMVISGPAVVPILSQSPQVDKLGRPIHYLGRAQICNNFNHGVCNFSKCRLLNIRSVYFRVHPRTLCPKKVWTSSSWLDSVDVNFLDFCSVTQFYLPGVHLRFPHRVVRSATWNIWVQEFSFSHVGSRFSELTASLWPHQQPPNTRFLCIVLRSWVGGSPPVIQYIPDPQVKIARALVDSQNKVSFCLLIHF